jgi:hypothetical protein
MSQLSTSFFQQQRVSNPHGLSTGIDVDADGIGIPVSIISYRSIPVPNQVFIPVLDCSGISIFFSSGTALTGCRTIRHSENVYKGRDER